MAAEPLALLAVRVMEKVPAAAYVCSGFCRVLVVPSPKFHSHDVGRFWLVSVNRMGFTQLPGT